MQIVLCYIDQSDVHKKTTAQQYRVVKMTAVVESELYRPTKWPQRHEQTHYWACFAAGGLHDTYTAFDRALDPFVADAINDDIIITESQLEADPILAVTFEASNFGGRKRRGVD